MGLGSFLQIRWCCANFHRDSGVNTLFAIERKKETGEAGSIPGWERTPGGGHSNHSNILAGKIPWTEEPSVLWPMWSQKDVHD